MLLEEIFASMGPFLVSVFILGSIYALAGQGFAVIWSTTGITNFAYGSFITFGAYMILTFSTWYGMNFFVSLGVCLLASFLLGVILYSGLLKRLLKRPAWEEYTIAATLGVQFLLRYTYNIIYGPRPLGIAKIVEGTIYILGIPIVARRAAIAIVAVFGLILLWLFFSRTKTGIAIRAITQNREAAQLVGIEVGRSFLITVAIGSALAGLSGALLGSIYFASPDTGFDPFIKAWIIVMLAGFGNISGVLYTSYIISGIEQLAMYSLGVEYVYPALFITLMVILILLPKGFAGLAER